MLRLIGIDKERLQMIQLKNIVKTYAGDVHALRGIDLTIERGSIYGIIGLSGAGKSTLIRCINMLERPTSGAVFRGWTRSHAGLGERAARGAAAHRHDFPAL